MATKKNSYGIVEYTPQAYLKSDLDMVSMVEPFPRSHLNPILQFFRKYSKDLVGGYPTLASIDGGYPQTTQTGFGYNGESDLDLEYAQALVRHQTITLYQVGDVIEGGSFNDFLDALDGSYCAGDDPEQGAAYPDLNATAAEGVYKGPKSCGTARPAYVISTSYGYNEADLTPAYTTRQCNEYAKLGLMGTTLVYSSGDNGVAGNGGLCLTPNGTQTEEGKIFNPGFPAGCPYVTSASPFLSAIASLCTLTPADTQRSARPRCPRGER